MVIEVGRVCTKIAGREAGRRCVIVDVADTNFVTVVGEGIRRRRCNVSHLELSDAVVKIKKDSSDEEILKKLK